MCANRRQSDTKQDQHKKNYRRRWLSVCPVPSKSGTKTEGERWTSCENTTHISGHRLDQLPPQLCEHSFAFRHPIRCWHTTRAQLHVRNVHIHAHTSVFISFVQLDSLWYILFGIKPVRKLDRRRSSWRCSPSGNGVPRSSLSQTGHVNECKYAKRWTELGILIVWMRSLAVRRPMCSGSKSDACVCELVHLLARLKCVIIERIN